MERTNKKNLFNYIRDKVKREEIILIQRNSINDFTFGIYAEGLTSDVPSKLENLTKTTEFSDIYKNVYIHIDVYGQSSGLQTIKLAQFETYLS